MKPGELNVVRCEKLLKLLYILYRVMINWECDAFILGGDFNLSFTVTKIMIKEEKDLKNDIVKNVRIYGIDDGSPSWKHLSLNDYLLIYDPMNIIDVKE